MNVVKCLFRQVEKAHQFRMAKLYQRHWCVRTLMNGALVSICWKLAGNIKVRFGSA